jgi:hypothetical protein
MSAAPGGQSVALANVRAALFAPRTDCPFCADALAHPSGA